MIKPGAENEINSKIYKYLLVSYTQQLVYKCNNMA